MVERINIGESADDGSGDTVRDAFEKTNLNFDWLVEQLALRLANGTDAMKANWPGEYVPRHVSDRAPDAAPPILGAIWINASEGTIFMAVGTSAPEDWKQVAFV